MPATAFSFRLIEQAASGWKVSPRAVSGYADGLKEYFDRCGWGRNHYNGRSWDKEMRKQLQRAIGESRALEALERDIGDLLLGTADSYPNKCPACFGPRRLNRHSLPLDYLIALDGNFQQILENNSRHDVQGIVPSMFLAEEEVREMKTRVEASVRPTKKACTESWKAADGGVGSGSSRVTDTGLVASVCRHDVNLKMVNLEKSGEKLYFALAIVKHISDRLPEKAKIGVLYDIACNFKHHIEKLLPELFQQLEFATSVFHAYAHIWACQVEFNPRLIPKFGLTDGEGCERLWSGLRSLISINRPSNKSHRLVNLAVRTQALNDATVNKFGAWLYRRYHDADDKRVTAQEELDDVIANDPRWTEDALRHKWEDQRQAQAVKTAAQQSEADRLRESDLYQLVEDPYRIESQLDTEEPDPDGLESLSAKQRSLGMDIDRAAMAQARCVTGLSSKELRHLCQGAVALRKFHLEVIAYKTSREKLLSTGRGKGGATIGQRGASRARATEGKIHSGAEKARKAYNKAVEAFQLAMGSTPSSLLDNLQPADSLKSAVDFDETDFFWQDGFFTHIEAAWAIDPRVKRGIAAVRAKDRALPISRPLLRSALGVTAARRVPGFPKVGTEPCSAFLARI